MAKKQIKTNPKKNTKPTYSKKELLATLGIALLLGGAGGYLLGSVTTDSANEMQAVESEMKPTEHSGSMFMVSAKEAPTVKVVVTEDAKSGYNVKIMTTNFAFTPENVNKENAIGEGHAHLYVDGEKIGRLYAPDFHYGGSFEGTKTFRVTLNANDHSEYAVEGEVISTEVEVTHDGSDPAHNESHSKN